MAAVAATLTWVPSGISGEASPQPFNYDFTVSQKTPSGLANGWEGAKEDGWCADSNGVTRNSPSRLDKVLIYQGVKLEDKFTVSAKVKVEGVAGAHFVGIAFNIQDANNFYVFRVNSSISNNIYQVLKRVNGKWKDLKTTQFSGIKDGTCYTLVVQVKEAGSFIISIKDEEGVVLKPEEVSDNSESKYTGGYAGIYIGSNQCYAMNFSINGEAGK